MTALLIAGALWLALFPLAFWALRQRSWTPLAAVAALWFVGLGFYLAAVLA